MYAYINISRSLLELENANKVPDDHNIEIDMKYYTSSFYAISNIYIVCPVVNSNVLCN